jgi:hypothetical protein
MATRIGNFGILGIVRAAHSGVAPDSARRGVN